MSVFPMATVSATALPFALSALAAGAMFAPFAGLFAPAMLFPVPTTPAPPVAPMPPV